MADENLGASVLGPEAKVKAKLKHVLAAAKGFSYWPVPAGYGHQMVDCLYFQCGMVYAFECKREGIKKATPRQAAIMRELRKHGVRTFVVTLDGDRLEWLEQKD